MSTYLFRVIDRGCVNGVPVHDGYLLRVDGPAEACVLHTGRLNLSPKSVGELADALGELGVLVEREVRPPVEAPPAPKRKPRGKARKGAA